MTASFNDHGVADPAPHVPCAACDVPSQVMRPGPDGLLYCPVCWQEFAGLTEKLAARILGEAWDGWPQRGQTCPECGAANVAVEVVAGTRCCLDCAEVRFGSFQPR